MFSYSFHTQKYDGRVIYCLNHYFFSFKKSMAFVRNETRFSVTSFLTKAVHLISFCKKHQMFLSIVIVIFFMQAYLICFLFIFLSFVWWPYLYQLRSGSIIFYVSIGLPNLPTDSRPIYAPKNIFRARPLVTSCVVYQWPYFILIQMRICSFSDKISIYGR